MAEFSPGTSEEAASPVPPSMHRRHRPSASRGGPSRGGALGVDIGIVREYLEATARGDTIDPATRERFIAVAVPYSLRLDFGVMAWRAAGVPDADLRAAGFRV